MLFSRAINYTSLISYSHYLTPPFTLILFSKKSSNHPNKIAKKNKTISLPNHTSLFHSGPFLLLLVLSSSFPCSSPLVLVHVLALDLVLVLVLVLLLSIPSASSDSPHAIHINSLINLSLI